MIQSRPQSPVSEETLDHSRDTPLLPHPRPRPGPEWLDALLLVLTAVLHASCQGNCDEFKMKRPSVKELVGD